MSAESIGPVNEAGVGLINLALSFMADGIAIDTIQFSVLSNQSQKSISFIMALP